MGGWRTERKPCGTSSWSWKLKPRRGAFAIEKVRIALVDQDEVLQRAREYLAKARTLAAEWEVEVASVHAQLQ
jgi:hypothetical protein